MRSYVLLLVGSERSRPLAEKLFSIGFTLLVRETIQAALKTARHERLAAVVFDSAHAEVDVLEFIFNLRDVDEALPVAVASSPDEAADETRYLARMPNVFIVDQGLSEARLAEKLCAIVETTDSEREGESQQA